MAGESVSTEAAPTPTAKALPGSLSQPVGAGWDPTALDALGKLNWQLETKLAGDKETLTELGTNYNQFLENQGRTEGTGFKALRSRNFASGLMNSGFALGDRQELAGRYTGQRTARESAQQFKLNRLGARVQEQEAEGRYKAGEIGNANTARAETARRKQENEAPKGAAGAGTPGGAYPAASATVGAAFSGPGGTNAAGETQQQYAKNHSYYVNLPTKYGGKPRARGGPVAAGHAYLVGEQGPELVVPKVGGRVVPNNRLAAIRKAIRGGRYQR